MGWLEKFFCLSVDEEEQRKAFCEGNFCRPGPINTIRKEPDERPTLEQAAKGMAKLAEAAKKAGGKHAVQSAKETVEGMRKREPKDSPEKIAEQSVPVKVPRNTKPELIKHVLKGEGRIFKSLGDMFDWSDTPQGQVHWQAVASAYVARDGSDADQRYKLGKNDREYLEAVLVSYEDSLKTKFDPVAAADQIVSGIEKIGWPNKKEWDMREDKELDLEKDSPPPPPETRVPTKLPDSYQRAYVNDLLMKKHASARDLWKAFHWEDTPQGNEYWKKVYDQLIKDSYMRLPSDAKEYLRALQKLDDECRQKEDREARQTVRQLRAEAAELKAEAAELKAEAAELKAEALAMKQSIEESKHGVAVGGPIVGGQYHFIGGGQTGTITESKTICLADHLKIHGQKYLIDLLVDVDYVYGDAVLKLCGNSPHLDVDEVTKELRKHMVVLREQLINEVQSWFSGRGRLLETGPEIVDCYLACSTDGQWLLWEKDSVTGGTLVREEICSRLAHHLILASDVCNLMEEQKVICLMNLILRR
jgi:hypothetical protein